MMGIVDLLLENGSKKVPVSTPICLGEACSSKAAARGKTTEVKAESREEFGLPRHSLQEPG
jgi:hypothetical protein